MANSGCARILIVAKMPMRSSVPCTTAGVPLGTLMRRGKDIDVQQWLQCSVAFCGCLILETHTGELQPSDLATKMQLVSETETANARCR